MQDPGSSNVPRVAYYGFRRNRELSWGSELSGSDHSPLFDALVRYDQDSYASFHMPGHKSGAVIPALAEQAIGTGPFRLDKTAVVGGYLDFLHAPQGVLNQACEFLARTFNAGHSYYLLNGAATGWLLIVLSCCRPGDRVLLSADIDPHLASAIAIGGCEPVFIPVSVDCGLAEPPVPPREPAGPCRLAIVQVPYGGRAGGRPGCVGALRRSPRLSAGG